MSIIVWFAMESGAIWVGGQPVDGILFRAGFIGLGAAAIIASLFLPKTRLAINDNTKMLVVIQGPWSGLWRKTRSIPLQSIDRVILRVWNTGIGAGNSSKNMRLIVRNQKGDEIDLFPPNFLPIRPADFGRSLAEKMQVNYQEELI